MSLRERDFEARASLRGSSKRVRRREGVRVSRGRREGAASRLLSYRATGVQKRSNQTSPKADVDEKARM